MKYSIVTRIYTEILINQAVDNFTSSRFRESRLNTKIAMAKAVLTKRSPFYISKYCDLRCGMCNIIQANKDLQPFSNEQIEKIADNLVRIGAGVVLLTG